MDEKVLQEKVNKLVDAGNELVEYVKANVVTDDAKPTKPTEERILPEGKRAVRTKQSGDRVYLLDDEKKTRQWVTNPEVLKGLGFELTDVVEVDESEMAKYQMAAALYRVDSE
jgi:hypothetical protein